MQRTSAPNIGQAPLPQRARGYWRAWPKAAFEAVERFLETERAQLPPWAVVGLLTGIALWFAFPLQSQWQALLAVTAAVGIAGFALVPGRSGRALGWFALAACAGCAIIWGRSVWVAEPRLERPLIATFAAKIERIEVLIARDSVRLTLLPEDRALPPRIRVSFDAEGFPQQIAPGARIELRARLAEPPPMALPGSHDFARDAWFRRIGGVGRAIGPARILEPGQLAGLDGARESLRRLIADRIPGSAGGIAIALVTGDQNGVGKEDAEAMRRSGLTHLLSVSGLHIAAVVGFAMLLTLRLLALVPALALRFNLVLVAAAVGALAGVGYTLLTGMQVPTVRSCIAALLVLAGIALGRDALSMRLVATGALIVLVFRPESAAGASFQMSFAAATAIVALHSTAWSRRWLSRREEGIVARFARALGGLVATGLAVEFALVPLALYHFHRAGLYGVAANILAIPLTTFVIMPLEALALLFDALGLGAPLWWLAERAILFLLWIAHQVAVAKGAVAALPSMPLWAFAAMVVGGLWLCLWQSPLRRAGLAAAAVGAAGAAMAPTPSLLVTGEGRHLAIVGPDGSPSILRSRSGDYIRSTLSEASGFDGEAGFLDEQSFSRCSRDACIADIATGERRWRLLATRSRNFLDWVPFIQACAAADIVVSDRRLPGDCRPRWLKLDRPALEVTGGMAVYLGETPRVASVAEQIGDHPWRWQIETNRARLSSGGSAPPVGPGS
ncbi:MAG: ComEC/Rec2 family competence protein [Sphingomicrobium sp.]